MSEIALPRATAPLARAGPAVAAGERQESFVLRLAAFTMLAAFGSGTWLGLVERGPTGRAAAAVAVAVAGGAAIALTPRLRIPRTAARALRVALLIAMAAAALVAAGLPAQMIEPGGWGAFRDLLDRGLTGASATGWPYLGSDTWVRLTIVLGIPAFVVPAAALAFWPSPRRGGALRLLGLCLLLLLYAIPATERDVGSPVGRGLLVLLLIGAWLWLPRLQGRELAPAGLVLAAAAAVALPVASSLRHHQAWIDYTSWKLFAAGGGAHSFDWTHRYGPIAWSRTGATVLEVRSPRPHYWKAETLDRFDGLRWVHSDANANSQPGAEIPPQASPRWNEHIRFTVRDMTSNFLVGAGTVYSVSGAKLFTGSGDGTVKATDGPLEKGDSYTVAAYVPDPGAREMRAAPSDFSPQFLPYTRFDLPARGASALTTGPAPERQSSYDARTVGASIPGRPPSADPAVGRRIVASPYGRMYALAKRLAAGQPTPYDVVRRMVGYLQRGFRYGEHPPLRRYPLPAFLFRDRIGYCQQFSGATALMLRMVGIPARVASGFAPGILDSTTKEYRVRDLDAHSWVEVWFAGIGWVPFDPTPSLAPASAQASGDAAASAARGGTDSGTGRQLKRHEPSGGGGGGGSATSSQWWQAALVFLALLGAGVSGLWLAAAVRARRLRRSGDPALHELREALERLGHRVPADATLLQLERRLETTAGPGAALYVRALRERRFEPPARTAASRPPDRRALRRALTRGRGPIVKVRALLALPPSRRLLTFPHDPLTAR